MRTTALFLIGIVLLVFCGCSGRKQAPPEPGTIKIVLNRIVDFDKAEVRPEAMPVVEEAAAMLNAQGNLGVVVEGHTDSMGSVEHNRKLSLQRAESVKRQLVKFGVDERRIVVVGKGAIQPVDTNDTAEGRARNRRVEIVIYQPDS
jgi:OOP family OmpA-OmpF porin